MKKLFVIAAFLLSFVTACTTTSAPEVGIYDGKSVSVRAQLEPKAFNANLKVFIQETLVVDADTKAFGGTSQSFNGEWNGKPVIARMTLIQNLFSSYNQIDVFVDGQLIETLTL